MRPIHLVAVLFLAGAVAPASAQSPDDAQTCLGTSNDNAVRLAACGRLIDNQQFGTEERPVAFLLARARIHYGEQSYADAVADLDAGVAIDPDNVDLHNLLGHAFLFMEQYDESRVAFEEAIRLDPESSWKHARLGFVLTRLGDLDGALIALDRSLELDPESTLALYYRARLHVLAERPEAALADFTTALEFEPFDDGFYFARGQIYVREGDMEGALHNYRIAELLNPNNAIGVFFDDRLPAPTIPANPAPVNWSPPEEGLRITYLEVDHEEEVDVDPMQGAIDALVGWFAPPERQLPFGRHFFTQVVEGTDGVVTTFVTTDVFGTMDRPPVLTHRVEHTLVTAGGADGDIARPVMIDDTLGELIWPLEPGRTASGSGPIVMYCPEQTEPLAFGFGCRGDVTEVEAGAYQWTASVGGWESILTAAGRRLTIRIVEEETRTVTVLGQEISFDYVTTWWFDPEINWWVRREVLERFVGNELGTVTTFEAIRIETVEDAREGEDAADIDVDADDAASAAMEPVEAPVVPAEVPAAPPAKAPGKDR